MPNVGEMSYGFYSPWLPGYGPVDPAWGGTVAIRVDATGHLQIVPAPGVNPFSSVLQANRVVEQAPLNLVVDEFALVDTADLAAATYLYPYANGINMLGFKDFTLTGRIRTGLLNTVEMTVWGTNNPNPDPTLRQWAQPFQWRSDTNAWVNSITVPASTDITYGWDFDNWNYTYLRVQIITATTGVLDNDVSAYGRRKAQ